MLRRPFVACSRPPSKWYTAFSCAQAADPARDSARMANSFAANLTACSFHNRRRRSLYANPPGLENQRMAKHLVISGRVQGVGFRYSISEEAERLGVTGWVRNRPDRAVEAGVAGGPPGGGRERALGRPGPPRGGRSAMQATC